MTVSSRSCGEGRQHLPEELVPGVAVDRVLVDVEAERRGQIAHGTERTRGGKRVAPGPQHHRCPGDLLAKCLDQGGLTHPSFAANQHHPPLSGGGVTQMLAEVLQGLFALE